MGITGRIFSASIVAALAANAAHAQQEPSPYSLALSAGHSGPGLNLSVVGRAQVPSSAFGMFGKVGATTYGRPETSVMGMSASAPVSEALSWGGGVSYQFTPRLSATFEWISYDLRMPTGPVRATNLGLQYRY